MPKRTEEEQKAYDQIMAEQAEIEAPCDPSQYRVLLRIASNPNNYLAVSYGSGSVPGLAGNTAMMVILEELGVRPHVKQVWGTSAGSIVAGAWGCGFPPEKTLPLLEALDRPGTVDVPLWETFGKGFFRFLFQKKLPDGFVRGKYFREAVQASQPVTTFEECEIPIRFIACTDDGHMKKVVLRTGPLVDAGFASMCIPGVFMPVPDWNGQPYGYMDGGVVENTPLESIIDEHKRQARKQQLVVIASHFGPRPRKPEGFLDRFLSVIEYMAEVNWEYQRMKAREGSNCKFAIVNPQLKYGGTFDFSYVRFNYLWARKEFKNQFSNAGLATRFDAR